ncbi:MAG: DNA repair protein RecO [Verrucomicrobiota bacterium]
MQSTPAILIRKIRLTETSLIVSWLTPEFGLIKTVAKGALRPKSRLAGILDLFHRCEIHFQPARSGSLHSLREATLQDSFPGVRSDYPRIALAAYAIELLEKAAEEETPVPDLFDLLNRALQYLNRESASPKALLHFESELARLLGVASPELPAIRALEKALHRLPQGRADLLARLTAKA